MFIKICGITNREDAELVVSAGADAIGFIFYKDSPRYIDKESAKMIIKSLPDNLLKVGVFVNEKIDKIKQVIEECHITAFQLHGTESIQFCKELKSKLKDYKYKLIKAFRINDEKDIENIDPYINDNNDNNTVDYILVDTKKDKTLFELVSNFSSPGIDRLKKINTRLIIAGGLNKENVVKLIELLSPYGVDISSGVEEYPGKKNHTKLIEFINQVKTCIL